MEDFLEQAATDIVTILTEPLSTTTPSLQAGDHMRNALLTLATQLQQIDTIPAIKLPDVPSPPMKTPILAEPESLDAQSSRVQVPEPIVIKHRTAAAQPPRVHLHNSIPASTLQMHSKQLKKSRYRNKIPHSYPLRSLTRQKRTNFRHLVAQHLTTQHVFQPRFNHIFQENGKKETIDRLLNSIDRHVWT